MQRIGRVVMVGVVLGSVLLAGAGRLVQAGEPQERVRETVNAVLTVLSDPALQGSEHTEKRRAKMRQAVFQRFGFEEMAQRALGPHWQKRTPAERKDFAALFGELLERSYVSKIESYTGEQSVSYLKETIDKDGLASVVTEVSSKRDTAVSVEYRLLRREGNWQVYDVIIEGISLVNNYRTQFNNIVTQESYEALVKKLKLKLEQERAGASVKG